MLSIHRRLGLLTCSLASLFGCDLVVAVGGEAPLGLPEGVEIVPEDQAGNRPADGSLGHVEAVETEIGAELVYRAPTRVPAEGDVRLVEAHSGLELGSVELAEGRVTYTRPFDALANEVGGPGLPALTAAQREDPALGRARIAAELDRAAAAGFNTVLVEAYYHGYTLWPTAVGRQRPSSLSGGVARYGTAGPVGGDVVQTWDPLAVYIEEAHARGLELHVWFETYYVWTRYFQSAPFTQPSASSWLWNLHPEWFNRKHPGREGTIVDFVSVAEDGKYFLDPAHPEVQGYTLALVEELYTNYPELDGLQLDYIRYPIHGTGTAPSWYGSGPYRETFGFNPVTFAEFEADTGITLDALDPENPTGPAWDTFTAWKADAVTELVRSVDTLGDTACPRSALSVSVFPDPNDRARKMQDLGAWIDEEIVDIVMPQLYYTTIAAVEQNGDAFIDEYRGRVTLYPTFYVPHLYDFATGTLRPEAPRYLDYGARRGADGVALFILTGTTTGISTNAAVQLRAPGAQFEFEAPPTHRVR